MEKENRAGINVNDLGSLLKYYRTKKGYSLREMFELTGISASYLNRIELGQRENPSMNIVITLSKKLGIPMVELLKLSMFDESIENVDLQSIGELLLYNKFTIGGKEAEIKEVEIIVDLVESVYDFIWEDGEEKNREIMELLTLIDRIKKIS